MVDPSRDPQLQDAAARELARDREQETPVPPELQQKVEATIVSTTTRHVLPSIISDFLNRMRSTTPRNAEAFREIAVEALVDMASLQAVLCAAAAVCTEKAEHIRHTWQDPAHAKHWDYMASKILHVAQAAEERSL